MISIRRLAEPSILAKKKDEWLQKFLAKRTPEKPRLGLDTSKYGHPKIREVLEAMSSRKCFYCEHKLLEERGQIDHYIEVAESPELAFEWTNLYLSCSDCNNKKLENRTLPVEDCLDPCHPAINPADHLTFDRQYIRPKNDSVRGAETIQKYRLDRDDLDHSRLKQLQQLYERLLRLYELKEEEKRKYLTGKEKEALNSFGQADHTFSLMFQVYLSNVAL